MMEQVGDHHQEMEGSDSAGKGKNSGGYLCRQSSTRWSPTTEQIRILKDLYYNNGVRSPTAEQIQRISAKLRQYGKIEGKNVFYWFQNHKARERQKKRFTAVVPASPPPPTYHHFSKYPDHQPPPLFYTKFPNGGNFPSSTSSGSPGLLTVGNYGFGSVAMEKSFRECTITPRNSTNIGCAGGGGHHPNFTWIGIDPYYPFIEEPKRNYINSLSHYSNIAADQTLENEEEEDRETLPLFPMQSQLQPQDVNYEFPNGWHHRCPEDSAAASWASLELALNSYPATSS